MVEDTELLRINDKEEKSKSTGGKELVFLFMVYHGCDVTAYTDF